MAGSRRQQTDQWRPEDHHEPSNSSELFNHRPSRPSKQPGKSLANRHSATKVSDKVSRPTAAQSRRSIRSKSPPAIRQHNSERGRPHNSSRSPAARYREPRAYPEGRGGQEYTHQRESERAPRSHSPSRHRKHSSASKPFRRSSRSRSPYRGEEVHKRHRPSARERSRSAKRYKQTVSSRREETRRRSNSRELDRPRELLRTHSPSKQSSSKRRQSPLPHPPAKRFRSRSPLHRSSKHHKEFPSTDLLSREHPTVRRSRSPPGYPHRERDPAKPDQLDRDTRSSHKGPRQDYSANPQRSPGPRTRVYSPRRDRHINHRRSQSPPIERQTRGRSRVRPALEEEDMRGSYHYSQRGRGDSRSNRPPPDFGYPPTPSYPHAQSPYGAGRGVWAPSPHYPSHHGSPFPPPPPLPPHHQPHAYRQSSYSASPPYHGGPIPPHPPPSGYYNGSSPYPHQAYPPHPHSDRRSSGSQAGNIDQQPGSQTSTKNSRRPQFSNLSWTPATGNRGGHQVGPRDRKVSRDREKGNQGPEDEDDPFRPSKDLRAEDENERPRSQRQDAQPSPPPKEEQPTRGQPAVSDTTKVKFNMKAKSSIPAHSPALDLSSAKARESRPSRGDRRDERNDGRQYRDERYSREDRNRRDDRFHREREERRARHEKKPPEPPRRRKKQVKYVTPTLSTELAESTSVYYRKQGNESVVGSGTYGKVYRAIHVYTGHKIALKKIRMEGERDGFPVTAIREVKLLQSLNHPNVVNLREVMVEKNDCFMVFEYLAHDLTGLLNHPTFQLSEGHKKHLAQQLFEGLDYLHKRGVLHRDIKAANILISHDGVLKLADFGLARFYAKRRDLDYTNRVITIWYRSPELLLGETSYGPAVDVWSAACVLVEIFTKHAIFPGDGGEINQLDKIYAVLGTPTRAEWPGIVDMAWFELLRPSERKSSTFEEKYKNKMQPEAFDLLKQMFSYDPAKRPTAAEVLEHPYFVTEEPKPTRALELMHLEGDWHEFESKALRKERERQEKEAKKQAEKRKSMDDTTGTESSPKRVKLEAEQNGVHSAGASTNEQ